MSLAVARSRALVGLDAPEVRVEVHLGNGLPAFHIVGLPEAEVRESRDRVRAALLHAGFDFPNRRLTVNLAPADLPKESGRFDLPIAIGILAASGQLPSAPLDELELVGELSLTGAVRPIRGALAMALAVARAARPRTLLLPAVNGAEAALVDDARLLGAVDLIGVAAHITGESTLERIIPTRRTPALAAEDDFADVKGQPGAKRALEIAAAGAHNLLMVGPPGAGKSLLAQRLPTIQPPLSRDEALETAALASLAGRFAPADWGRRPFRAPHHGASAAAIVGGGANPRPGEASLAHHGVLFLDELPEFSRTVLEALREPLETGRIGVARAARQVEFPARFQLVAAMNPCPCGYLGSARCRCTPEQVRRYQARLSGPLLDRIDILLGVRPVDEATLMQRADGEPSAAIAARVAGARTRQLARQGKPNAHLAPPEIDRHCALDDDAAALLRRVARLQHWSSRALHRVHKLARTIADLDRADTNDTSTIAARHAAEAVAYRRALGASVADGTGG
ncbi:MAG: YifB family Mg chelatase-like AAA ATPase [Burkholderiaceae bacterium]|nr:YifB family Mg chelatase-like AAA ATPase [Burkholderiaceae bacterium]MEB2352593.1 YifB family Mg chelatase-like AAA ATPase [Burkholderiaceae bacterium]